MIDSLAAMAQAINALPDQRAPKWSERRAMRESLMLSSMGTDSWAQSQERLRPDLSDWIREAYEDPDSFVHDWCITLPCTACYRRSVEAGVALILGAVAVESIPMPRAYAAYRRETGR